MIIIHAGETGRAARVIVGGSIGGCLGTVLALLLIVASITACLILKRKHFNLSTNTNTDSSETSVGNQREAKIDTEVNIAYRSVHGTETIPAANAELEVVYDTPESLQSTENMEQNMEYGSFTVDRISLGSNVAYYKYENLWTFSEESDNDHDNDQYDYISN